LRLAPESDAVGSTDTIAVTIDWDDLHQPMTTNLTSLEGIADCLEIDLGALLAVVTGGASGLRESVARRAVEMHRALPRRRTDCPTCLRPVTRRANRRCRQVVGQLSIDWNWRPPNTNPKPYAFADIEPKLRGRVGGDTAVAKLLRCSWFTLSRYRAEGLSTIQAERIADILGEHPTNLWPHYGTAEYIEEDEDDDPN
jgi:hypothetical protein